LFIFVYLTNELSLSSNLGSTIKQFMSKYDNVFVNKIMSTRFDLNIHNIICLGVRMLGQSLSPNW